MKKIVLLLHLVFALLGFTGAFGQGVTTDEKLSVEERMAKARAAKAQRKMTKLTATSGATRLEKATSADYKAPVDKVLKGPNGEVIRTGERGARYYINKNGNKTYLSSNQ